MDDEEENEVGASDAMFNCLLEVIAKLIESKAKTPEEAAAIVRNSKIRKM